MHLKIPIDLHFDACAPDVDFIEIPRGTPMAQWVVVSMPNVVERVYSTPPTLAPESSLEGLVAIPHAVWDFAITRDQVTNAARNGDLPRSLTVELMRAECKVEVTLSAAEVAFLCAIYEEESLDSAIRRAKEVDNGIVAGDLLDELVALGVIEIVSEELTDSPSRRADISRRFLRDNADKRDASTGGEQRASVVVTPEGRQFMWPATREMPNGWSRVCVGSEAECIAHMLQLPVVQEAALGKIAAPPSQSQEDRLTDTVVLRINDERPVQLYERRADDDQTDVFLYTGGLEVAFAAPHMSLLGRRIANGEPFTVPEVVSLLPSDEEATGRSLLADLLHAKVIYVTEGDEKERTRPPSTGVAKTNGDSGDP